MRLLTVGLLLLSINVTGQKIYNTMTDAGYRWKRGAFDSTLHIPIQDTSLVNGLTRRGAIVQRVSDSALYMYNGARWVLVGGSSLINSLSGKVDSVTVSADTIKYWKAGISYAYVQRTFTAAANYLANYGSSFNARSLIDKNYVDSLAALLVRINDTANMLSPYLRANVAASLYASIANLNLKLNISDTASMLSPYLRSNVAAATYATLSSVNDRVPYTGANNDVDLADWYLYAGQVITRGNGSTIGGSVEIKQPSSGSSFSLTGDGYTTMWSGANKFGVWYGTTGFNSKRFSFLLSGLTDNTERVLTVPNQSGTIALTSDLAGFVQEVTGSVTTTDGSTVSVISIAVPDGSHGIYEVWVSGVDADGTNRATAKLILGFHRSGATVSIELPDGINYQSGGSSFTGEFCYYELDGTNLLIRVVGIADTTIKWKAWCHKREAIY
jgi:hypothetical protein